MKHARALFAVLKAKRWVYLIALLGLCLGTLCAYTAPLVIKTTIDSLLQDNPLDSSSLIDRLFIALGGAEQLRPRLWIPALVLVGIVSIQGILTFFSRSAAATAAEGSIRKLREQLFGRIQRQPFAFFGSANTGDLIQRCTSDVDTVRRFLETQLIEMGNTTVMIFIALALMFSLYQPLAWLMVPIIPLMGGFSFVFFLRVQKAFTVSDESEGRLSAMLSEHLTGIRVVKAFGREAHEIQRFEGLNGDYRKVTQKLVDLLALYWGVTFFLSMGQVILIVTQGSIWAVRGNLSLGTLQVFISYVWMILQPMRQLGRILVDMGKAFVSIGRINEILHSPEEDIHPSGVCHRVRGAIRVHNLSFRYVQEHAPVLRNLTFSIEPGETIGILGPTGAGKSTLLHLLAGLYREYEGGIFIDSVELRDIRLDDYRRQIGYVLQEPYLFSGTIVKNIRMGRFDARMSELEQAAQQAQMHHVITEFDRSYQTMVGERGVTLSGGQRQRLAIARAMVRESKLHFFDDSLSALDAKTDADIRDALMNGPVQRSTIIVSHRLSTLAGADRIMVLENGRISQFGAHSELVHREGLYKRLWELQRDGAGHPEHDARTVKNREIAGE